MYHVCLCFHKKIESELSSHETTLEDLRKKNQNKDKDPSPKIMGQMDLTQVQNRRQCAEMYSQNIHIQTDRIWCLL